MRKVYYSKRQHQWIVNIVLTGMLVYSSVTDTKRDWTAIVVTAAFVVMIAHPGDFITKETASAPVELF